MKKLRDNQLSLFAAKPITTCQRCGKPVLASHREAHGLTLTADKWCYGHSVAVEMGATGANQVVHCQNSTCGREIFVRQWLPGGGGYSSEFRSADGWCFQCDEARRKAAPKKPRGKRVRTAIQESTDFAPKS